MIRFVMMLACALAVAVPAAARDGGDALQTYVVEAEAALQKLRGAMMREMDTALKTGVEQAIDVCRHAAPEIEARIARETGWQVRRVALRTRNPANAADAREAGILRSFEVRSLGGQDASLLRSTALVERDGRQWVHFMQAIPTFDGCLACHGDNVAPSVAAAIRALYPKDDALGYKVGDIRGAFSMMKPYDAAAAPAVPAWDRIAALPLPETVPLSAAPSPSGNAQTGRALYARHCRNCHAADDLAARYYGPAATGNEAGLCRKLETHGFTDEAGDCDILAFLKALAASAAAR